MKKMTKITTAFLSFFISVVFIGAQEFPMKATFEPYYENGNFPGIVTVVADKDKILQVDKFGFRNIEKQEPITTDSLFWIASQSKTFAAVAVMFLVEEGKLSLDEPVTTYLPEFETLRVVSEKDETHTLLVPLNKPITLRHLLSHTSGITKTNPFQSVHGLDSLPLRQTVTICSLLPLESQPGTEHIYSNMGIDMAALIVERVAKIPYEDFLQQRIFDPLGMNDTTFFRNRSRLFFVIVV
jgi:CubicO group peptidase (beta-lactamase class C family)